MAKFKFKNSTGNPMYLPTKRGGSQLFRPGESTSDPWFSRFVGPNKLSKVPISGGVPSPLEIQEKAKEVKPRTTTVTVPDVEEKNSWYQKISGIYHCLSCDMFRTGSRYALGIHLRDFHGLTEIDSELPQLFPKDKNINITTLPRVVQEEAEEKQPEVKEVAVKEEEQPVEKERPVAAEKEEKVSEKTVFQCNQCDKKFETERGLAMHVGRTHK